MSKLMYTLQKKLRSVYSPFLKGSVKEVDAEALFIRLFVIAGGLMLPNAVILGGIAPFGIAYVSCFYLQKLKFPIMFSTAIGYIFAMESVNSLRYLITLCVLYIFTVAYERSSKSSDDIYIIPLATALTLFGVGGVYVALEGFLLIDMMQLVSETLLCFLSGVLFMSAVPAIKNLAYDRVLKKNNITAIFILLSVLLIPITHIHIGELSIGRILGVILVISVTFSGSIPFSTMCGTIFGIALGLTGNNFLLLCTSYGVASLIGSMFASHSRFMSVVSFVVVNGVICIYGAPPEFAVIWLYEVMIASILALLLPISKIKYIVKRGNFSLTNPLHESKIKELTISRLNSLAGGFREVYETVQYVSDSLRKVNFADTSTIFEGATAHVCASCKQNGTCWGKNYTETMDSLQKLLPNLRKHNQITGEHLRSEFQQVCLYSEDLVREINLNYGKYLVRRKISEQQAIGRNLECEQFIGMSGAIEQMAAEIDKNYVFDTEAEERITTYLNGQNIHTNGIMVLYDGDDKARVEIDIRVISDFRINTQTFLNKVSNIVEHPLANFDMEKHKEYYKIVLTEKENLHPIYAHLSEKKTGESYNGDTPYLFKNNKGKMIMVLADGMGSGKRAAIDSTMAAKIVEKVMNSGFDSSAALNILNTAMVLSSSEDRVTAIDISIVDLYSGNCDFVKAGAAPTYVRKGGVVYRLDNQCIPTGIMDSIAPEIKHLSLRENDYIVMVSDGICGEDDSYLIDLIRGGDYNSPKDLSEKIMKMCKEKNGDCFMDDSTVIAMLL